jgi:rhamnulokinase
VSPRFLALDLGAGSGRAMLGSLHAGALELREIHRFPNEPVRRNRSLQWDVLGLWQETKRALDLTGAGRLESVGVDSWGVDFALLGEHGELLENPYHYRDKRTEGMMEAVFKRVSREKIYAITGIQFLPINTLFQLYAASLAAPDLVGAARAVATIPDLLNYWLTGALTSEYTIATTTQLIDAQTRSWATEMLEELGLPTRLLLPLVEPGTLIGEVTHGASARIAGTPVVAPGCHDTASAVAAVSASGTTAFLSCGTWSLLGTELPAPIITLKALALNFTNEGGVCGTTRLLKNIGGLWLLQSCRRRWAAEGHDIAYEALLDAAADETLAFRSLIDPDHPAFLNPSDMPASIARYCRDTRQPEPASPPAFTRTILESLAFKYRAVLESLEGLTGGRFDTIRVVGGGSRNRLLKQWTADATGRTVLAGPVEATALGNIAMQMIATGAVASLAEARAAIDRSFPLERLQPIGAERWDAEYHRFQQYLELTCA